MTVLYWAVLCVCTIPLSFGLAWVIFDDLDGFVECVKYWIKPDILSWIQGEHAEDWWSEMKLFIWIALSAGILFGLHWVAQTYIV